MLKKKPILVQIITKSELGGAQRHVYDLIKCLQSQYEIHLVVGELGWLTDECYKLGVSCHCLPRLNRQIDPLQDILALGDFIELVKKIKPDLIHAHSGKPGVLARLAAKICRVPVIFTAHGWGFAPNVPTLRRTIAFIAEKLLTPLATKIICVCESDRQLAIRHKVIDRDRAVAIYNGIDRDLTALATPEIDPPQAIVVARFNKQQKDQHTLLQAIKKLDECCDREFNVVFVGTGPDWEEAKTTARDLNILDRVTFLGNRLDVKDLLARSQMFILPTHYEGFPIGILEAMRAGLPVIATGVNGIAEQVVDGVTGLLVPHQDVEALSAAILKLVERPALRRQMGEAGAKMANENFTVDQMATKIDLLYRTIINRQYQNSTLGEPSDRLVGNKIGSSH